MPSRKQISATAGTSSQTRGAKQLVLENDSANYHLYMSKTDQEVTIFPTHPVLSFLDIFVGYTAIY